MDVQRKTIKSKFAEIVSLDIDQENSAIGLESKNFEVNQESKKKRMRFSYNEKMKILKELKTVSEQQLCEKYKFSHRTLRKWKCEKDTIEEAYKNPNLKDAKKKTHNQEMDDTLYQWVLETQQRGIPVSGPMIKQQAIIVNRDLQSLPKFNASNGWLTSWKNRKNVRRLKIGEKLSTDCPSADKYKEDFKKTIITEEVCEKQVFNMDEIANIRKEPKCRQLPLKSKLLMIKLAEKGVKQAKLAEQFGVSPPTVSRIMKEKGKYKVTSSQKKLFKNRARLDNGKLAVLEKVLYEWMEQKRALGISISGPILQEKALYFNRQLGGSEEFKASQGWLMKFKDRFGIRQLNIEGEQLSANSDEARECQEKIEQFIEEEQYNVHNVFNGDKTVLVDKSLPKKSLTFMDERKAPGYKQSKERVTVMNCSNATESHEIPLMVICKSLCPRCFKDIQHLPVVCRAQSNAGMNIKERKSGKAISTDMDTDSETILPDNINEWTQEDLHEPAWEELSDDNIIRKFSGTENVQIKEETENATVKREENNLSLERETERINESSFTEECELEKKNPKQMYDNFVDFKKWYQKQNDCTEEDTNSLNRIQIAVESLIYKELYEKKIIKTEKFSDCDQNILR